MFSFSLATRLSKIGLYRYYAICRPLQARHLHTIGRALLLVCCFWLVAAIVLIPQLVVQRLGVFLTFDGPNATLTTVQMCTEYFPDHRLNVAYTVFFYVFLCILPVLVVFVAYGRIGVTLWHRSPMVETPAGNSRIDAGRRTAEKQRVVRMLIVIVVFFTVSWFPFFTAQVYLLFDEGGDGDGCQLHFWYRSVAAALHLLAYSNSCVNPVVYCLLNDSFKQSLRRTVAKACARRWRRLTGSGRRSTLSDTVRTTAGLFSISNQRRGSCLPTAGFARQISLPPQRPVSPPPPEEVNQLEREPFSHCNRTEVGTRGGCHGDRLLDDKSLTSDAKVFDKCAVTCTRPNEMQESNSVEKQSNGRILNNEVDSVGGRKTDHDSSFKSVPSNGDINDALDPEMTATDDLSCAAADILSPSDSSTLQEKSKFSVKNNLEASSSLGPKKSEEIIYDNKRMTETHPVRNEDGDNSEHRSKIGPVNETLGDEEIHLMRDNDVLKIHEEENDIEINLDCQTLDVILSHLLLDAGVQV